MPETEPVVTEFIADTSNLVSGANQAKAAIAGYGNEVDKADVKQLKLVRTSNNLLGVFLQARGVIGLSADMMEKFAGKNDMVRAAMEGLATALNIGILALGAYRIASALASTALFIEAKAGFLAAIAKVSATTFFIGTAVAVGSALAAWGIVSSLSTPHAQFGGIVPPRPGGTSVVMGEAGVPEAIVPLDRAGDFGLGRGGVSIENMNVYANDPREFLRQLGREAQHIRASGG